jgi:hypothetical protein
MTTPASGSATSTATVRCSSSTRGPCAGRTPRSAPGGPSNTYHIYDEKLWRVVGRRKRLLVTSNDELTVLSVAADGAPAEPLTLSAPVPNWRAGDTIPLGYRTLRVIRVRDNDADQPPVLVVEDVAEGATRRLATGATRAGLSAEELRLSSPHSARHLTTMRRQKGSCAMLSVLGPPTGPGHRTLRPLTSAPFVPGCAQTTWRARRTDPNPWL